MKTILLSLLAISPLLAQGPLTPPGAPAPTMKSLDQIEPRIPISSLPYTINTSGSYYFTGNLAFSAVAGHAIRITASNVTLDLMGYTLSSTADVTGLAIYSTAASGITIRNGKIQGTTTVTITGTAPAQTWTTAAGGFSYGILDDSTQGIYEKLQIRGCRFSGLFAFNGGCTVKQVTAASNGYYGIYTSSGSVTSSTAHSNGDYGIFASQGSVTNSTASSNGNFGISAPYGSVINATATSNGDTGILALTGSVTNSTARFNGNDGILASYGSVTNSTAASNGNHGIIADYGSVANSTARSNGNDGISVYFGSVTNSTASSNGGDGIFATSGSVTSSTATSNGGNGIYATSGSVTNSTAQSNTGINLFATDAVVAFCKYTSGTTTGSTLTGNLTP